MPSHPDLLVQRKLPRDSVCNHLSVPAERKELQTWRSEGESEGRGESGGNL